MLRHLLKRQDIGPEPHPLPLVALDRLGHAGDRGQATGEDDVLGPIAVELDERRVGRAALLAELEPDVGGDVVAEADGPDGGLGGPLQQHLLAVSRRHPRSSHGAAINFNPLFANRSPGLRRPAGGGGTPRRGGGGRRHRAAAAAGLRAARPCG